MEHKTNNLTILRLILATMVVFGHFKVLPALSSSKGIYSYADFAVDAFFVISGYLVYASFDKLPKVKGFYIKRLFRVYPLYVIMVLLQALAMVYLLGANANFTEVIKYIGSNLIFANFLHTDIGGLLSGLNNHAINPSLWTLKIEVAFYLIVPIIWWFTKRFGTKILLLIFIASTAFSITMLHLGFESLAKQLPAQLRFFVIGIACYHYYDRLKIAVIPAFIVAIMLFITCSYRYDFPAMHPVYPIFVGALVFICSFKLPKVNLKYDISFGVYLIHAPLIQLAQLTGIFEDNISFLFELLFVVYVLAFIVEKTIELPMIRLGKKLAKKAEEKPCEI